MRSILWKIAALAITICAHPGAAVAQSGEGPAFTRNLQIVVSFGSGGGYDLWARAVARHMGQYLAGKPAIVVQNMPGAGGYTAANYVYNLAPKDGSVIGLVAREAPLGPLTGADGARFDSTKFGWIGTPTIETSVCIVNASARAKIRRDAQGEPLVFGDTGSGSGTFAYARGHAALLDFRMRFVSGFPSTSDIFLAMERKEVDGVCEGVDSIVSRRPDWIAARKVEVLSQSGRERRHEMADVPTVYELAKSDDARKALAFIYAGQDIGRPFIAPPDLAPGRLGQLREAFEATMKTPAFVADAAAQKLPVEPKTGVELEQMIRDLYATPQAVLKRAAEIIK